MCEKIHWYFHEEEDNSEKTSSILSPFELPHKVRINRRILGFTIWELRKWVSRRRGFFTAAISPSFFQYPARRVQGLLYHRRSYCMMFLKRVWWKDDQYVDEDVPATTLLRQHTGCKRTHFIIEGCTWNGCVLRSLKRPAELSACFALLVPSLILVSRLHHPYIPLVR